MKRAGSSSGSAAARKKQRQQAGQPPALHDKVSFLPESALYSHLTDFENRLDAVMARKRQAINEALKKPKAVVRKLRVFLANTFDPAGVDADGKPTPASWTLKIQGFVQREEGEKEAPRKMSQVLSRVVVQLDKEQYPVNWLVEWDRNASQHEPSDGFTIVRLGDQPSKVRVLLEVAHDPPRYKASSGLCKLLGTDFESRTRYVMSLWHYVRRHSLQEPSNRKLIRCNAEMQRLFGCETMQFEQMMQMIEPHLSPMRPIELVYTIAVSPEDIAKCEAVYDIDVEVPDPQQQDMTVHALAATRPEEARLNDQIHRLAREIESHTKRREFLLVLAQNPVLFLQRMLESQVSDAMALAKPDNPDELRQSSFWSKSWIEEAVAAHLLQVQREAVEKLKAQETIEAARAVNPLMGSDL